MMNAPSNDNGPQGNPKGAEIVTPHWSAVQLHNNRGDSTVTAQVQEAAATTTASYLQVRYGVHDLTGYWIGVTRFKRDGGPQTAYIPADDLDKIAATIARFDAMDDTTGVFLGQSLADAPGPQGDRYSNADARAVTHLWAEVDFGPQHTKPVPPTRADAMRVIDAIGLRPSTLKHSGNGFHVEFALHEPWEMKTDADRAEVAELERHLVQTIGLRAHQLGGWTVDNVHDLARVMRVPGTTNRKDPDNPKPCVIEVLDTVAYEPDDIRAILADKRALEALNAGTRITDADQRAMLDRVNLQATWREARDGRAQEILELLKETGFADNLIALWNAAASPIADDSSSDLGLGNSAFALFHSCGEGEALRRAALFIMASRLRTGRKVEKVDPSERHGLYYLTRTLALVAGGKTQDPSRHNYNPEAEPVTALLNDAQDIGPERAVDAIVASGMLTQQQAHDALRENGGHEDYLAEQSAVIEEPKPRAEGVNLARQPLDDAGNGERFALFHAGRFVVRDSPKPVNYTWTGAFHQRTSPGELTTAAVEVGREAQRQARDVLRREAKAASEKDEPKEEAKGKKKQKTSGEAFMEHACKMTDKGKLDSMVTLGLAVPAMRRHTDLFDVDTGLFNTETGTLRFDYKRVGTLHAHDREDLLTRIAATGYDADAIAPEFAKFVQKVLPDPAVRNVVQALLGITLVGGNPAQVFAVFNGVSETGKSTLLKIASAVMGDYAATFKLGLLRTDPEASKADPELVRLIPKRMIWASEAGSGNGRGDKRLVLDAEQIKRLTSDPIPYRDLWKGADETEDRAAEFIAVIATNVAPQVNGVDEAFRRRLVAVPFNEKHTGERDGAYAEKLAAAEGPGILRWLVDGAALYGQNPSILRDLPEACVKLADEMCIAMSIYHRWWADHVEMLDKDDRDGATRATVLWTSYFNSAKAANEETKAIGNKAAFVSFLEKAMGLTKVKIKIREGEADNATPQWTWWNPVTQQYVKIKQDESPAPVGPGISI